MIAARINALSRFFRVDLSEDAALSVTVLNVLGVRGDFSINIHIQLNSEYCFFQHISNIRESNTK